MKSRSLFALVQGVVVQARRLIRLVLGCFYEAKQREVSRPRAKRLKMGLTAPPSAPMH